MREGYEGVLETWAIATDSQTSSSALPLGSFTSSLQAPGKGPIVFDQLATLEMIPDLLETYGLEARNSENGQILFNIKLASETTTNRAVISSASVSPDGSVVTVGGETVNLATNAVKAFLNLWSGANGASIASLKTAQEYIVAVAVSADAKVVADSGLAAGPGGAAGPGNIELWNAHTGASMGLLDSVAGGAFGPLAFSPDDKTLATFFDLSIQIWNYNDKTLEATLPSDILGVQGPMKFSPDGSILADCGKPPPALFSSYGTWPLEISSLAPPFRSAATLLPPLHPLPFRPTERPSSWPMEAASPSTASRVENRSPGSLWAPPLRWASLQPIKPCSTPAQAESWP